MPRKKAEPAEKKTRRGRPPQNAVATKKTAASSSAKKAFVFFNCDAEKSAGSKNIFYNNEVFRDVVAARKALWSKVKEEIDAGRVQIGDDQFSVVRHEILEGSPVEAGKYLHFGSIEEILVH